MGTTGSSTRVRSILDLADRRQIDFLTSASFVSIMVRDIVLRAASHRFVIQRRTIARLVGLTSLSQGTAHHSAIALPQYILATSKCGVAPLVDVLLMVDMGKNELLPTEVLAHSRQICNMMIPKHDGDSNYWASAAHLAVFFSYDHSSISSTILFLLRAQP